MAATKRSESEPATEDLTELNRRLADEAAKATTAEARAKSSDKTTGET